MHATPVVQEEVEEDIPDALEVDDAFDTDEALQAAGPHADETGATQDAETAQETEAPQDAPEELREVVGAMMDSVRDTYSVLARRLALFKGVRPEDVAKIFSQGATREYEEGQTIFECGQAGDEMFVILGGQVEIHDGGRTISTLERGAMFGEMALFSDQPRSASARTTGHTSLLVLTHNTLREELSPNVTIQLLLNIINTLSDRLRTFTGDQ
jgi:CRP-like cAMP-binding protein